MSFKRYNPPWVHLNAAQAQLGKIISATQDLPSRRRPEPRCTGN